MMGTKTDEIIEELFKSFLLKYQEGLEESMRRSEFVYDGFDALYYNLNKVNLSRGESYIDTPKCLPKSFIDQYNWKEIDFLSNSKDQKKFESNNKSVALSILHVLHYTKEIRHAYKSKYNLTRENQVILLMITDGEKWPYVALKSLSPLFTRIRSNNNGYFYCLNCFQSYTTKKNLKNIKSM